MVTEQEMQQFYKEMIAQTRANFDTYRASGNGFNDDYLKCKKSFFAKLFNADKRFDQFYKDQDAIYKNGQIVWGHIIQANRLLYDVGDSDCPAAIIYSTSSEIDSQPDVIGESAYSLFDIKGADTDPELAEFSRKLADEMEADWKLTIPKKITQDHQCYYLTNMIFRKHLPQGYLAASLFPLLICPEISDVGFILPSKFWPEEFIQAIWQE